MMSPFPLGGSQVPPMLAAQMGRQGENPWVLHSELKRDYNVKTVEMSATSIPDDVKVLIVIHPREIRDATQYAIDQFVLRGGKLIAFLDPSAALDRASRGGFSVGGGSNLDKLLKGWGVQFDSNQVVSDMKYLARTGRGRAPGVLALSDEALANDDVVTADASNLLMVFPGAFSGTPVEGLKETVLVKSSKSAQMSPEEIVGSFISANQEYPLAIRLTGKFKTVFPDGAPKPAGEEKKDEKQAAAQPGLKESAAENTVILVGDSDMLQNQVAVIEQPNPFGGRMLLPANGNLAFAQNAVEQLSGDSNLIAVRSRASRERPFTVVQEMQQAAESSYRSKIQELEGSLADTEREARRITAAPGNRTKAARSGLSSRPNNRRSWRNSGRRRQASRRS